VSGVNLRQANGLSASRPGSFNTRAGVTVATISMRAMFFPAKHARSEVIARKENCRR